MGYIPEQHLHARGTPRTLFLTLTAAMTAAASLAVAFARLGHLYVLSVLLGVAFGAHWSLLPAITRSAASAERQRLACCCCYCTYAALSNSLRPSGCRVSRCMSSCVPFECSTHMSIKSGLCSCHTSC
jgi:hypothetical protein